MKLDVLRDEITADEGCKYEIYLDHLDLPTMGIGHGRQQVVHSGSESCRAVSETYERTG